MYIGFEDEDRIIESREEFVGLDPKKVFTDELVASVKNADDSGFEPCMAGFMLMKDAGMPSISFGVQNGKLGITGINY